MIEQSYDLNLIPGNAIVCVNVSQYDIGRGVYFRLLNGKNIFEVPLGTTATIDGTKPDGKGFSLPADISSMGVRFDTTKNMCAVPGKTICEIRLTNSGQNIGTANFILNVERAGLADNVDISETELPAYMASAEEAAEDSEAYAIGTRGGDPVGSSDPAYNNNSKYYAQQASTSATNASSSATTASNKATAASGSANDAAASAAAAAASVASGTQVRFYIDNGDMYVVQTIGGVEQQPVNLGQLEGAAVRSFDTVAAMNTAVSGGDVPVGTLCCVKQNLTVADVTSY